MYNVSSHSTINCTLSFSQQFIPCFNAAIEKLSLPERNGSNISLSKVRYKTTTSVFTPPPPSDRRFYFEKPNGQTRLMSSLPVSFDNDPPMPLSGHILNRSNTFDSGPEQEDDIRNLPGRRSLFPFDLPHEFPLTKTVSTSTDLDNNSDSELNYCGIFTKHVNKSTTTTIHSSSVGTTTKGILKGHVKTKNDCQGKRTILRRSKEDLFNEFCKKTGRFIKPRNIYYIDDGDEDQTLSNKQHNIMMGNPRELQYRDGSMLSSQPNLHQIGRSKTYQSEFPEPLYINDHFDPPTDSSSRMLYQSQTLPRNFMKGSSQSQLYIPAQRQFLNHNGLGNGFVNRSFDNILGAQGNWPKCIPTSPSPSLYSSRSFYAQRLNGQPPRINAYSSRDSLGKAKRQELSGFDLDKIEKDCRISHASLFQGHYNGLGITTTDYSKSTAV